MQEMKTFDLKQRMGASVVGMENTEILVYDYLD